MDPLTILRDFTATQQLDAVVVQPDGRVAFADKYAFPSDTPTAFRSKAGEHYSLLSVATFIKTVQAGGMTAYIASVGSLGVAPIEVADRRSLADYLSGKISHCANLAEVVPVVPLEPASKKQRVAEPEQPDTSAAALLFGHEKQLRDRNSLLCAPGANFRSVVDMVDRVMAARKHMQIGLQAAAATPGGGGGKPQQAAAGGKAVQQQQQQQPKQQQQQQQQFMKASGRMERQVDVRGALKALGADASVAADVGLGYGMAAPTAGAAATAAAAAGSAQQQQQRPAQQQQQQQLPQQKQQQQQQRSSSKAAGQAKQARVQQPGSSSGRHNGPPRSSSGAKPIILVPQGFTALINRYNARQFLEHGSYVPSEEARVQAQSEGGGAQPEAVIEFARTALREGPKFPRYQLMDKVPPPKHPDWKRVVAVIVMGKPWQFKGFPFKGAAQGDMVETFNQLFGAYLHFSDEAVPDVVRGWNVALLPLRRTARHLDATVMMEFYQKLDAFLVSKRRAADLAT